MDDEPDEAAKAEQREVQRLLGRCILQLQRYERLLKALLSDREISGPVQQLRSAREQRETRIDRTTLGLLVQEFVGAYLVVGEAKDEPDTSDGAADGPATVSYRVTVAMSPDDHDRIARGLKELVALRNGLVHQFVEQHDLWSMAGCKRARAALEEAFQRIESHFQELVEIARTHDAARQAMAQHLQSEAFRARLAKDAGALKPTQR